MKNNPKTSPNIITCNSMLDCAIKSSKIEEALKFF